MSVPNTQKPEHERSNRLQSIAIVFGMFGLLALTGFVIWGPLGVLFAAIISLFLIYSVSRASPKMILKMYKAKALGRNDLPELQDLFDRLVERAGLEHKPTLFYVPSEMMNAFATGRNEQTVVAVTHGLLQHMNNREIGGVLAHELSHIKHNDVWVMGLADVFSRLTNSMGQIGQFMLLLSLGAIIMGGSSPMPMLGVLVLIFAPAGSVLLQLALSRSREFEADYGAAQITGDPAGLASALTKIEKASKGWMQKIMPGRKVPQPAMLRTHPATEERIERLMEMEGRHDMPTPVRIPEPMVNPPRGANVQRRPRWHIVTGLWY